MPCEASTTRMPANGRWSRRSASDMFRHRDPIQRMAGVPVVRGAITSAARIPDENVACAQPMAEAVFRALVQELDAAVPAAIFSA